MGKQREKRSNHEVKHTHTHDPWDVPFSEKPSLRPQKRERVGMKVTHTPDHAHNRLQPATFLSIFISSLPDHNPHPFPPPDTHYMYTHTLQQCSCVHVVNAPFFYRMQFSISGHLADVLHLHRKLERDFRISVANENLRICRLLEKNKIFYASTDRLKMFSPFSFSCAGDISHVSFAAKSPIIQNCFQ